MGGANPPSSLARSWERRTIQEAGKDTARGDRGWHTIRPGKAAATVHNYKIKQTIII